ncbi:MAG: methyltransferase domain-containing protein [Chloroflexota bacterium]
MSSKPPVCNYEGSDYQQRFWEQGGRAYEDGAESIALQRLLPTHGNRLLEVGAGAGRNTPRYQGYKQIVLLDYSRSQLEQARSRLGDSPRYRFIAADVYHLPFVPALFDGATMIRTLHHMTEAHRALESVHRVLQKDAVFILEFANKRNLKAILRYWLRRQTWNPFSPEPVEFVPLNFDFHPATVRAWLQNSGFAIQRMLTVSHFRFGWLKRCIPTQILVGMDSLAQLTGDWWQLSPSVFTRCRVVAQPAVAEAGSFFACPACAAPIEDTPPLLTCPACGREYPLQDGIYDFRLD